MTTTPHRVHSGRAFFIVWCPTGPHPPRIRHPDERSARAAAEDMARRHPGETFVVMAAVTGFTATALVVEDYDGLPF